jgi:chromosome segregation ATPase
MPINSVEDLLNALNFGSAIRQTDATAVNAKSSRSHAVFSLNLVQKKSGAPLTVKEKRMSVPIEAMSGGSDNWITVDSKLHFVDLAGSERLKNTQAQGERAREGISINAGLASLGKVISQLSSQSQGSHVSYRDSKLTRLLQDALGGNAITYMIACVNPAEFHLSETLNTVQYAQRARAIQVKPQIQQVNGDSDKQAVIDRLRSEVQFLRDQIRLSERTDRIKANPQERAERQQEREMELNNQLLDFQENYNALSSRHAKLISEITKARDNESAETPMLKDAIGDSALERLKRSNSFAEAVESVVLEYEKTIQSLEASLSSTRSTLSSNESELLEKETRIAFLESQTHQLQARLQKAIDREASNEGYVKDLEAQVDSSASGIEKNDTTISDLREKLQRARENENSAEDYISTLEERVAENEQEVELMQREIERLKHVVERQRSIGKLDNLLYELDNIRQTDSKGEEPLVNGHPQYVSDQTALKRVASDSHRLSNTNVDTIAEEDDADRSTTAGAAEQTDEPVATNGIHKIEEHEERRLTPTISTKDLSPEVPVNVPQSPAQSQYVQDKLESVTQELFDLRVDHERTVDEYDKLASKYQEALETLAALQDAVDEARQRRSSMAASSRPTSFLADAGVNKVKKEDGQPSSSRSLSAELSLVEPGNTTNLAEEMDAATEKFDAGATLVSLLSGQSTLTQELETLKLLNAEKEHRMAELNHNYAELQEQHQDTLDYVEELKSEVTKAHMARPSSPTAHIIRRKSSQNVIASDRSNRAFASLRNMALENFEEQPDSIQNFELNLNAIMTELHMRSERVQALETEVASVRKEMEGKMTLISGLAKERSSLKATSPLDISIVATMQDQIRQSEDELRELKESHKRREQELQNEVAGLRASLERRASSHEPVSPRHIDAFAENGNNERVPSADEVDDTQLAQLRDEANHWQQKHMDVIELSKHSEKKHLETVQSLESAMKKLEAAHSSRVSELEQSKSVEAETALEQEKAKHADLVSALQAQADEHKATAVNNASRLAELEQSHANIVKQVEDDAESRRLTEKELDTHRFLVSNLEKQIEEHKAAIEIHQQGFDSLKQSHSAELEKLTLELEAKEMATRALQTDLTNTKAEIDSLMKGVSAALDQETDMTKLESHIRSLVDERKTLSAKMEEATSDLASARAEFSASVNMVNTLKGTVKELELINAETIKELEKVNDKERKSSRLVQELEDQITQNYDQHEAANNRLSALQTERGQELQHALSRRETIERQHEESLAKIALLEVTLQSSSNHLSVADQMQSTIVDLKRHSHRESLDPRDNLHRSNSKDSNLRKSNSHNSLPSPPPAIPLPPLPGSPPPQVGGTSPPASRHQSKDIAHSQLVEDQEARIRTIEKHLFAEKQLTATLEDALTDLEASSQRTKKEVEEWRKRYTTLDEEMDTMRKERSMARHSLQAVEEERNARLRVEAERAHLEARMAALNSSNKKKSKKGLNCF